MNTNHNKYLSVNKLSHKYEENFVLDNISFSVFEGEIISLLGPSGSGKSTLLKLIAGLETLKFGNITLDNKIVSENNFLLPPEKRDCGFVFQDLALFPHLTVIENIEFGLKNLPTETRKNIALNFIKRVGVEKLAKSYPHDLSGGEQQRVALARAIARKPKLMLLDEPFSDLDSRLRDFVRDDIIDILKESGSTVIVVTHDPLEAMLISDRIILINNGKLVQQGSTSNLYFQPINKFVAGFFGNINTFDGSIINGKLNFLMGEVSKLNLKDSLSVDVVIRNEGISLKLEKTDQSVQAKIEKIRNLGYYYKIDIRLLSKQIITSHIRNIDGMFVGSEIWAEFDPSLMYIFYKENG